MDKKLAPFKKEMDRKLRSVRKEKKNLFAKEFKELCGERYEAFSKFIKKVRGIALKEYPNQWSKEETAWMKKASIEEYLFDGFQENVDNWFTHLLNETAKTLPPQEKNKVALVLWKLHHT